MDGTDMVTEFAEHLFSFMALKYDIVSNLSAYDASIPVENQDWSTSDDFTVEIAHAVLMYSYGYRSAFKKQFNTLSPLLSPLKAKFYPVVFAQVTYTSHSPMKFLVICALISEMYLFLFFRQRGIKTAFKDYIVPCIACFNSVYRSVWSKVDDPFLYWRDVKRFASLLDCGYDVYQPIMETEHPSESKDFFETVECIVKRSRVPPAQAEGQAKGLHEQASKSQDTPIVNVQEMNEDLCKRLKYQSHRFSSKVAQPVKISGASSSETTSQGTAGKKSQNKNASLGASGSGTSFAPESKITKKSSKTPSNVGPSAVEQASKKKTTAKNIDESLPKGKATGVSHGKVSQTEIPGSDASSSKMSQGTAGKIQNKNASLGASTSGVSIAPDSKITKKSSKTSSKEGSSAGEHASKKKATAKNIDKSLPEGEATGVSAGTVSQTEVPGLDGEGKAGPSKSTKPKKSETSIVGPSAGENSSKKKATTKNIDKSLPEGEATGVSAGTDSQTEVPGSDGKAGPSKNTKRKNRAKAKLAALKAANEADPPKQTKDQEPRDSSSSQETKPKAVKPGKSGKDGDCLDEFSKLAVKDDESEESGEESLV